MAKKPQALPNRIRELRQLKGWSLEELAFHAGLTLGYVSQLERGVRDMNDRVATKLAEGLGVMKGELLLASDLGHSDTELRMQSLFRAASPEQQETILRVAEGLTGYRAEPADLDAPRKRA